MKRLIILTSVLILTAGTTGCRCCSWLWRGPAACQPAAVTYAQPCAPTACDPCGGGAAVVAPGPETYAPAVGP